MPHYATAYQSPPAQNNVYDPPPAQNNIYNPRAQNNIYDPIMERGTLGGVGTTQTRTMPSDTLGGSSVVSPTTPPSGTRSPLPEYRLEDPLKEHQAPSAMTTIEMVPIDVGRPHGRAEMPGFPSQIPSQSQAQTQTQGRAEMPSNSSTQVVEMG